MSFYLKLLGSGLLLLSALLASSEYSSYADRRLLHYSGVVALLSHAEGVISRFLSSGGEMWREFKNDELEKIGLLPLLREGETLLSAFQKCEAKLYLSVEAKEKIKEFLSTVGKEYRAGAVSSFAELRQSLESEMKSEKDRLEKQVKIVRALLLGGALAFVIFIM